MITSTANQQVKNILALTKKSKERKNKGIYIVEGLRMFAEAPKERIAGVYVSESFLRSPEHRRLLEGMRYEVLTDAVFSHVSDTQTPQGILCLLRMPSYELDTLLAERENGLWLVLESIQDPGNLGTMLRSAEAAGAAGVIMDKTTVDIYNPKTIRSTMGSIYRVPFVITESIADAISALQAQQFLVYAAHLEGSVVYDEPDYTKKTAILIGNEGNGLKEETAALADQRIRIPMMGQVESLNAAMAAGILLYEAQRQKRHTK